MRVTLARSTPYEPVRRVLSSRGWMLLLVRYDWKDRAAPEQPGTLRGPVPTEYVRLKAQLEADLQRMTACAAQPPKPGAEEGRATQGGIAAGIRTSLAWAIQCFEGSAAREAFLKRLLEGDR
ncbi:hypothetical protein [Streptomyces olivochromogenes]|uniref:hypothetical protein n=1 Tax=Streptomyces olivochromogenes TaxID=1963 RepID=UPI00131CC6A1|nr:hypothetical protein [Streptomyces olivochromogenes]